MRPKIRIGAALLLLLALLGGTGEMWTPEYSAAAGVPRMLNHQGRLYNASGTALGGAGTDFCFKFSIYDDATVGGGDVKLWPAGSPSPMTVVVRNGAFSANVGDTNAGGDVLDYDFESNENAYLNVEVASKIGATCAPGDGAESFENLSPRQRIVAAGYAINSATLRGFTPSQTPTGSNIPVLNNGNLTLGGVNPQLNATGSNALVLQGGGGTGEIRFFNSSNTLSSAGALTLQGALTASSLGLSGNVTLSGANAQLNASGANTLTLQGGGGTGNIQFFNSGNSITSAGALTLQGALTSANVSQFLLTTSSPTFAGLTLSGFPAGSILFATTSGVLASSSNLYWSSSNIRLGIGTANPSSTLHVVGNATVQGLSFSNATGTSLYLSASNGIPLQLIQGGTGNFLTMENGSGIEQFRVSAQGNVIANGFIAKQMQYSEEFLRTTAAVTNDTAGGGTTGLGDTFAWGVGSTANGAVSVAPVADAINGTMQLRVTGGVGRGGLLYLSAGAGNRNDILNATSSPIIVMKLRPSVVGAANIIYAGMADFTDAAVTDPANGIYFTNASGTTWTGVARSNNSQTSVTCTGQTISTTTDAYFRIQVNGTSSVEFFLDNNTSNGIDTVSCGTVTSTIPTLAMTAEIMNQVRTGGTQPADILIDYVRLNQDDPVVLAGGGSVSDPGAGADIAENIFASEAESLEPGDVLSLEDGREVTVKRSGSAYEKNLYGVVPTSPGLLLGEGTSSSVRIALAGRVPVKANLENGPIAVGDWLTSSHEPGVAMKATRPGMVLGRALEAYDGSDVDNLILATVEVREWSGGALVRSETVSDSAVSASSLLASMISGLRDFARVMVDEVVSRIAVIGKLFVKDVTVLPGGTVSLSSGTDGATGHAVLSSGSREVTVSHSGITAGSKILLTPNVALEFPLAVVRKSPGEGFTVALPAPAALDIAFDWILLGSDDEASPPPSSSAPVPSVVPSEPAAPVEAPPESSAEYPPVEEPAVSAPETAESPPDESPAPPPEVVSDEPTT